MTPKKANPRRRSSHRHQISGAMKSGGLWYVKCSCPWKSKLYGSPEQAEDSGDQHRDTLEGNR